MPRIAKTFHDVGQNREIDALWKRIEEAERAFKAGVVTTAPAPVVISPAPAPAAQNPGVTARKNSTGTPTGVRPRINFIEGANVALTLADDATDNEIDLTIATAPGAGAFSTQHYTVLYTAVSGFASFAQTITLSPQLPAGAVVWGYKMKHSVAFTGGSVVSCTATPRFTDNTGETTGGGVDIFTPPAANKVFAGTQAAAGNQASPSDVKLDFATGGGTLNALNTGSLDFWVLYSVIT